MRILSLQALRAVMETGSVTEAAARILRTQPQVSRLIAELEVELGFRLFARERQRLRPTAEGTAFYREAERILTGFDQIGTIAEEIRERRVSRLRIVCENHLSQTLVPAALSRLVQTWPDAYISLEVQSRREVPSWVVGNQFDLGLMVAPIDHPAVRQVPFAAIRLVVAVPKRNRLAARTRVALSDLAGEPMILLKPLLMLRERTDEAFARSGVRPIIRAEVSTGLAACHLVSHGLGITITDPLTAGAIPRDRVKILDLAPALELTYAFLFPVQVAISELAEDFVSAMRDAAAAIGRHRVRVLP